MGINRFSTTGTTEYTPQHVPLPFDTITKMGEQVKLEHDTADAALAAEKFNIQPGLRTVKHAEELNAKKNALLAEAQARAEKTGNYGRLTQDVKEIGATIKNDPKWQGIQRDIAQTERANKQRFDPNFKYAVQNYTDDKGNIIQLESDQAFDENQYNVIAPVDFYKDHSDVYNQIKEQSVKQGGPSTSLRYTKTYDSEGNELIQGFNQQNQKVREGIAPEDVAAFADRWIQDPNNMRSRASVGYKDAYLKQKEQRNYTPQEYKQDLINNFPGYREKIIDVTTEKALPIENAPRNGSGRSGGGSGGGKTPIEVPNQFVLLADAKQTQATTPVLKDLGYAPGPADVPGSYMVSLDNTDGQGAIVNFAKVTPDNPQANNVVTYGNEINNIKKNTGIEDNETFLEILKAKDSKSTYQIVGNQIYVATPTMVNGKNKTKVVNVPIEAMKDAYLKTTDDFKLLADEAKENGVDISDPKFKDNYLKTLGVKTIKEAEDMGQKLNITGQYPFILKDGNNKVNVGDKAFLDGYIIMTRAQIDAEMAAQKTSGFLGKFGFGLESDKGMTINPASILIDDWEEVYGTKGKGNGLIQPYSLTREKEGDAQEQFKIPVKKPIQISQIANQNYNSSFYGTAVTGDESQHHAETFNDWQQKNIMERRNKVFGQSYTNNPTTFKNNIVADISSDRNINADVKGELFNIINELENNPKATKETWVGFKNALSLDGAEEILKRYKNNGVVAQSPATVGKSQGGWSQTPATPLKK